MMLQTAAELIGQCPYLSQDVNMNYLAPHPNAVSVSATGENTVLKRYTDGAVLETFGFSIDFRTYFSSEYTHQKKYFEIVENTAEWLGTTDFDLPLDDSLTLYSVKTAGGAKLVSHTANTAHYTIPAEIKFIRK